MLIPILQVQGRSGRQAIQGGFVCKGKATLVALLNSEFRMN